MVKELPLQMVPLFTVITGRAFTVINLALLLTQPAELVPVTLNVVLTVGVSETVAVVAPELHA
jgi:hypothetical protein